MPGSGLPPKDADKRARRNKDRIDPTVLVFIEGKQPELPPRGWQEDGSPIEWHPQTLVWWETWGRTAQSATFTETDWTFLLDTALIHDAFWRGNMSSAPELRLRVAKFGVTPEDRARLRMVFADADEKDAKRGQSGGKPAPGTPYAGLRAVPGAPGGA